VSAEPNTKSVNEFMAALLNVKQCSTLINIKGGYKYYGYKTDEERQQGKKLSEYAFYPQLNIVIKYPSAGDYQQEEFFNGEKELSGVVLLDRSQWVCIKKDGEFIQNVQLGDLMLEGLKDRNPYIAHFFERGASNGFINLNQYLIANGLRAVESDKDDPRTGNQYFSLFEPDPAPEGVKRILTVGAAQ
jgi:hypothetical protein